MDDFEQFLKQQPPRSLPPQWRAEILAAVDSTRREHSVEIPVRSTPPPTPWWLAWLWPSPVAWAGVACAWVLIFGLEAASLSSASSSTLACTSVSTQEAILAERYQLFQQYCLGMEEEASAPSEPSNKLLRRESPGAYNWHNPDIQIA